MVCFEVRLILTGWGPPHPRLKTLVIHTQLDSTPHKIMYTNTCFHVHTCIHKSPNTTVHLKEHRYILQCAQRTMIRSLVKFGDAHSVQRCTTITLWIRSFGARIWDAHSVQRWTTITLWIGSFGARIWDAHSVQRCTMITFWIGNLGTSAVWAAVQKPGWRLTKPFQNTKTGEARDHSRL